MGRVGGDIAEHDVQPVAAPALDGRRGEGDGLVVFVVVKGVDKRVGLFGAETAAGFASAGESGAIGAFEPLCPRRFAGGGAGLVVVGADDHALADKHGDVEAVLVAHKHRVLVLKTGDGAAAHFVEESYFIAYIHCLCVWIDVLYAKIVQTSGKRAKSRRIFAGACPSAACLGEAKCANERGFSRELARVPPVLAKQSVQTSGRAREKPQDFRGSNSGKRGLAHCLQLGAARFLRSAVTAKTVAVTGIPEAVTEKTGALTVSPVRLRETRPAGRPVPVCGVGGLRNCPVTALRRDRSS